MNDDSRILHSDSDRILGENQVFEGTCVPVQKLFEYLAVGKTVDKFLSDFPFISREQVIAALDQVAYGVKYELEPHRPVFRWLFGAFVSPPAVAFVYLFWTEWTRYPYRAVTDYAALALGIGIGVLFLGLLPIPWWVRVGLSVVYITVICYVTWWLYMFTLTAQAWS